MAFSQRLSTIVALTALFLLIAQVSSFKLIKRQASNSSICPTFEAPAECPEEVENFCDTDANCPSELKCCNTGCELDCVAPADKPDSLTTPATQKGKSGTGGPTERPVSPDTCPVFVIEAPAECPVEREDFCEDDRHCLEGFKCCFNGCGLECADRFGNTSQAVIPRPGTCPVFEAPAECPEEREDFCKNDSSCPDGLKCCNTGCEFRCVVPDKSDVPTTQPTPKATRGRFKSVAEAWNALFKAIFGPWLRRLDCRRKIIHDA